MHKIKHDLTSNLWPPVRGASSEHATILDLDQLLQSTIDSRPPRLDPHLITRAIRVEREPPSYSLQPVHYFLARMIRDFCFNWRWSLGHVAGCEFGHIGHSFDLNGSEFRSRAYALICLATIGAVRLGVTVERHNTAFRDEGDVPGWRSRVPAGGDFLHSTAWGPIRILLETGLDNTPHLQCVIERLLSEGFEGTAVIFSIAHVVVVRISEAGMWRTEALRFFENRWDEPPWTDFLLDDTADLTDGMLALARVLSPVSSTFELAPKLPPEIIYMVNDIRTDHRFIRFSAGFELELTMDPACKTGYLRGRRVKICRVERKILAGHATIVEIFIGNAPLGIGYKFKE